MNRLCKITLMILALSSIIGIISKTEVDALYPCNDFSCYIICSLQGKSASCKEKFECACIEKERALEEDLSIE
uniref:Potassium channel toxin meuK3-1-a n=1 Tax=Mesobuthus eupeus TaxID=34648 RepID=A0A143MGX1_MESEU|nr:potassium channel toxin meuK3-1-a [Mesobuthus eupeus]